jgi:hypothetical protein
LAVRRLIRRQVAGRDNQQRAWQAIVKALHTQLPLPPSASFWDIQREVSQERHRAPARSTPTRKQVNRYQPSPLKRKLGSRPLASRKLPAGRRLASRPFATRKVDSKQNKPDQPHPQKSKPLKPLLKRPPAPRPVRSKVSGRAAPAPARHSSSRSSAAAPAAEATSPSRVTAPRSSQLPDCFWSLGFEALPTRQQLRQRFLQLATVVHPDMSGTKQDFKQIKAAYELAVEYLNQTNPPSPSVSHPTDRSDHAD